MERKSLFCDSCDFIFDQKWHNLSLSDLVLAVEQEHCSNVFQIFLNSKLKFQENAKAKVYALEDSFGVYIGLSNFWGFKILNFDICFRWEWFLRKYEYLLSTKKLLLYNH